MEELQYDQLIDALIELRKEEADKIWEQGSIVYVLREKMRATAGDVASQIGVSSVYVNDLARTFAAFPDTSDRSVELSFTHHKMCAKTDNPMYWLEQAEMHQYSSRQLSEAIKGKPTDNEIDKARKLFDKIVDILESGGPASDWLVSRLMELEL